MSLNISIGDIIEVYNVFYKVELHDGEIVPYNVDGKGHYYGRHRTVEHLKGNLENLSVEWKLYKMEETE